MIFKVEKRHFRKNGELQTTRGYYLRYRIGDMPVDRWKSLGTTDFQVANKKAQEFIQEKEREAAGILEPKLVRDSAQRPLVEHLNDYEADLLKRGRAGRGGRGARLLKSRILRLLNDCGWKLSASITADSFIAWRNRQTDSARTLNHYLQGTISFLNWMERGGRIKFNPMKNVSKVDGRGQKKRVRRAFTDDELCRLVQGSGLRGIIYFTAARTGLRWEELRQLAWNEVHLDAPVPHIVETLQTVSIKSHFNTWLESKSARKSKGTGERYGVAVEEFLKTLGKRANKNLTSLTAADVQRFLDHRTAKGLAPKTVNVDVKIIRGALNAARRQGLITTNPAEAVELPEAVSMERGTFTPAEVKMLVDTAEGEWKLLIMLAYFTGARLSDCCRMQWEGVDLTEETLTYTQAKTGAKVTTPLHPDLLTRLNKLAGTDKPEIFILPHMANLRPGGRHGLSESFKNIMRKAGVDSQTVKGAGNQMFSRRSFHALRHSFTSALANQNVSSELRMKLTGHKTEGEHRKYTHHEMDNLRAAVKKIPSLG